MPGLPDDATVVHADIRDYLRTIPDDHFDVVIADGPYGIGVTRNRRPGQRHWDNSAISFETAFWAEIRRVTKPGGTLAAFGHARTFHRQSVAAEDAGWRIIDHLSWLKSHGYQAGNRDLGAELQRAGKPELADDYAGWGTHLRPSYEPILIARNLAPGQSLVQTIADGGTGGLNLNATRINAGDEDRSRRPGRVSDSATWSVKREAGTKSVPHRGGRLPGNLVVEHAERCSAEACDVECAGWQIDAGGRQKYASGKERASRFFSSIRYSPRAPASERPAVDDAAGHASVKPQALLGWVCALTVRPGSLVLDPFSGSGAVAEAVLRAGARVVSVEIDAGHMGQIEARLSGLA